MKKWFLSLSAVALLMAGSSTAKAQAPIGPPPGPIMPAVYGGEMGFGGGYYPGGHVGVGMHGAIPGKGLLSGLFTNHGSHKRRRLFGADPERAQMLPVATGGTLVFPQNPFVRSPRDFFMYDR